MPDIKDANSKSVRTSVTIASEDQHELERIAKQKKVSVAWVIREAIEQYLNKNSPLSSRTPR